MPDAFNIGRKWQDTKPYAPKSNGRTPYELAAERGLLDRWLIAGSRLTRWVR